jgi:predicted unusual protein kinase regulating ubiquinone biosynthesis (AarF/ABC1/UbiB family)
MKYEVSREGDLPTGRFARLSRIARVGARSGLSLLGRGDGSAAAEQAVALLGNLRGLAAKVGQMASYVDGFVPEAQREAYERILSGLQNATTSSPFSQVSALIEDELGAPLSVLFAELDETPMASASIGQVHRARLHAAQGEELGVEVAVKVQHPGIESAIETDLNSAGTLASFVSALGPKAMNVRAVHDEVAERFREELDYRLEARRQSAFAVFHAGDAKIHVPCVIASHSSRRVLTSELVRGHDFAYATQAPETQRRDYAQTLWRFVFKAILVEGMFNADPHPGNYIFHEDGRISFLDFGSVQVLEPAYFAAARGMHQAALSNDEAAFRVSAARACQTRPGPYETDLLGYLWRCFDPLKQSPYRLQRSYVADVVRSTQDLKRHMLNKKSNVTPPPSGVVLLNRLQFGFYSVLARLDVTVDYAALDRGLLAMPLPAPRS